MDREEMRSLILALIEEEFLVKSVPLGSKWQGGKLILEPQEGQSKEIPVDVFFKKILAVRESLRVLEQKLNGSHLPMNEKVNFQSYITKAYGSLTTFNVLFKEGKDKFVGFSRKKEEAKDEKLTLSEAKRRISINEYGKE